MTLWSLLAAGVGAYFLGLIAAAPATLVDAGLRQVSEGRLRLAEARGTLWSGTGRIEFLDAERRFGVAQSLAWRVLPESLWRGRLVCELDLGQAARPFAMTASFSGVEFTNAEADLPAAVLGIAVPALAPLGLGGEVSLRAQSFSIGRRGVRGNATLQWRTAGSALTPLFPLGDYELRLDGENSALHPSLRTLRGPLWLEGKGGRGNNGKPAFVVTARVPSQHRQQLAPLMRLFAIERGEDSFELQIH